MKTILFNTEMVRAILAGQKTVTRRAIKPQPKSRLSYVCMGHKCGSWSYPGADAWKYWEDESFRLPDGLTGDDKNRRWMPPCHTDDILYVRETWAKIGVPGKRDRYVYKATDQYPFGEPYVVKFHWHPSIHMPREAARIFLRVTDVRVERLQDITTEQIKTEGVPEDDIMERDAINQEAAAKWLYETLWDSTIKPADRAVYGWAANPWVWVIEFERVSKEEAGGDA